MEQKKETFKTVAYKTLEFLKKNSTVEEIWSTANSNNLLKNFTTNGKTPTRTLQAQLYTDIKNNKEKSLFYQATKHPVTFGLNKLKNTQNITSIKTQNISKKNTFKEKALHPLLLAYIYSDDNFDANGMTINHEKSNHKSKKNEWLHPDIVGVSYPFSTYTKETLGLMKGMSVNSIKLFSFEMKIEINMSTLRQYYFQAVSNSSWANEGYLVALHISDNSSLREEMKRLNQAFGIGIIQLDCKNIHESQILYSSKTKESLDWNTIDRLSESNPDFKKFIIGIKEDCDIQKVKTKYPELIDNDDKLNKYIEENNIK